MIGGVVGLLTLLAALTMGLLIWTAYGVLAGQNTAILALAAKFLQLDLALADCGPADRCADPRIGLRESHERGHRPVAPADVLRAGGAGILSANPDHRRLGRAALFADLG
jgi:hypothetical protein